jgi:hypothetical protein
VFDDNNIGPLPQHVIVYASNNRIMEFKPVSVSI